MESARRREHRRDEPLIAPDRTGRRASRQAGHGPRRPPRVHRSTPRRPRADDSASSSAAGEAVAAPLRATIATSRPSQGPPARLTVSRITRLHRLRHTAPPTLLPATKTTRPSGPRRDGVGRLSATSSSVPARRPCLNSASISLAELMVRTFTRPGPSHGRGRSDQALRTLRPLRRRAARTARPPAVAMRARKPCVLARLRVLGWKVLFTTVHSIPCGAGRMRSRKRRLGAEPVDCILARQTVSTNSAPKDRLRAVIVRVGGLSSRPDPFRSLRARNSEICGYCGKRRIRACCACG